MNRFSRPPYEQAGGLSVNRASSVFRPPSCVLCLLSTVCCLLSTCPSAIAQKDFKWSWEGKGKTNGAPARVPPSDAKRPGVSDGDFRWSWEKGKTGTGLKPPGGTPSKGTSTAGGVSSSAYNELLADNLELRKKLEKADTARRAADRDKTKLERNVRDLEQRLTTMVAKIKQLQQAGNTGSGEDLDKVVQLETRLAAAKRDKGKLQKDLDAARKEAADARAAAARAATAGGSSVAPGSDLLREMERENRLLKSKMVDIETARQELERARERLEQEKRNEKRQRERVQSQLSQAKAETRKYQRACKALQKEIPRLKERLGETGRAGPRTRLDPDRKLTATTKEQRDMHYNMGVLFQQEGRFKDAEKEYLRAMRIDPSDPDVHYNLGVLYDDSLDSDSRAAVHYKVYLRLKPSAADAKQVREWLTDIEGE